MNKKTNLILSLLLTYSVFGFSQNQVPIKLITDSISVQLKKIDCKAITLQAIDIIGNKKTKSFVILGEMNLNLGDSIMISDINRRLQSCAESIYNTNLFSEVSLTPILTSNHEFKISINVIEKWPIYPIPYFQLSDRNFNEWWSTYHGDLKRTIYGILFSDINFSGKADRLNVGLLNGFSRLISANYSTPLMKNQTMKSVSFGAEYSENKSFAYKTNENNKLVFYNNNLFVKKNLTFKSSYIVRRGLYSKQSFGFQYNIINIDDSAFVKNYSQPYLNDSAQTVYFPDIIYQYQFVKTNNNNYPTKGKVLTLRLLKRGLGLAGASNMFSLDASLKSYFSHKNNFYSSFQFITNIKLPFKQGYINQRALGYGENYLRGMEYYVVDGVALGISKFTLSKKILSCRIPFPLKSKTVPYIPLTVFGKSYIDMGYVYSAENALTPLNDKFLYTGGIGIDFLSIYDMRFSLEFSFNQMKEKGLFLHSRSSL